MNLKKVVKILLKIFIYFTIIATIVLAIIVFLFYKKFLEPVPSVVEFKNSIHLDKESYVKYNDVSKNIINAIVASEDKYFFTRLKWNAKNLARVILYKLEDRKAKIEFGSIITQQLIRNTYIINETSIERDIKLMFLYYKIETELSREEIIELYLNSIYFWSNTQGIEQASEKFFGKDSKDLWILESSILASLPKAPSYYSPYNNYERLMGYPYTYQWTENEYDKIFEDKILTKDDIEKQRDSLILLKNYINNFELTSISEKKAKLCWLDKRKMNEKIIIDNNGCSIIDYSDLLNIINSIKIEQKENIFIAYHIWRKDFILQRMLEDNYITFDDYKKALIESFAYEFKKIN